MTAAERAREERERATRRRRTSVRIGSLGLAVLFASGIGVFFSPGDAAAFLGLMAAGIVLLAIAFLLVRPKIQDVLELRGP